MPIVFPGSATLAGFYLNSLCHASNPSFDVRDNILRSQKTQNLDGGMDLPIVILNSPAFPPS
jgi:hypothetical protein